MFDGFTMEDMKAYLKGDIKRLLKEMKEYRKNKKNLSDTELMSQKKHLIERRRQVKNLWKLIYIGV